MAGSASVSDRKNVLMIVYDFPPNIGGGRVMRAVKFAKYLPLFGWHPLILTVKRWNVYMGDRSLLDEIEKAEIFRTVDIPLSFLYPVWDLFRKKTAQRHRVMDRVRSTASKMGVYSGWYLPAMILGSYVCARYGIKMLFSTSPPHVTHSVGLSLKQIFGIPCVCDFRDSWADNPIFSSDRGVSRQVNGFFEDKVVHRSDHLVCPTESIANAYRKKYPDAKVSNIYNGFDEDDFRGLERMKFEKFTISYLGSGGGRRTLEYVVKAMELLPSDMLKDMQLLLIGHVSEDTKGLVEKSPAAGAIKIMASMPHREALRYLISSDALLIVLQEEEDKRALTGKIFEYLRSGRPVLATCPADGDLWDLVSSFRGNICAGPKDVQAIRKGIEDLYLSRAAAAETLSADMEIYSRGKGAGVLADIFDDVLQG